MRIANLLPSLPLDISAPIRTSNSAFTLLKHILLSTISNARHVAVRCQFTKNKLLEYYLEPVLWPFSHSPGLLPGLVSSNLLANVWRKNYRFTWQIIIDDPKLVHSGTDTGVYRDIKWIWRSWKWYNWCSQAGNCIRGRIWTAGGYLKVDNYNAFNGNDVRWIYQYLTILLNFITSGLFYRQLSIYGFSHRGIPSAIDWIFAAHPIQSQHVCRIKKWSYFTHPGFATCGTRPMNDNDLASSVNENSSTRLTT